MLGSRTRRLGEEPERPGGARRGHHPLPHGHRGHARAHRPALHHRLQRARGHAARLRAGLQPDRARRAPPRRLRRPLPAREGERGPDSTRRRSSARWRRRCRSRTRCSRRRGPRRSTPTSSSASRSRTRGRFAVQALTRRLKVIGLAPAPSADGRRGGGWRGQVASRDPAQTAWARPRRRCLGAPRALSCSRWPPCSAARGADVRVLEDPCARCRRLGSVHVLLLESPLPSSSSGLRAIGPPVIVLAEHAGPDDAVRGARARRPRVLAKNASLRELSIAIARALGAGAHGSSARLTARQREVLQPDRRRPRQRPDRAHGSGSRSARREPTSRACSSALAWQTAPRPP